MQENTNASVADYLFAIPQYFLPHHAISRLTLWVTRLRITWLKNGLMKWFIRHFNVNMQEAEVSDYRQYENFNSFFTRALKKDLRTIATGEKNIICPVDGAVSQTGKIQADTILQAKGHNYSVKTLLGGYEDLATTFQNGAFVTLYLSPRDYHRIHMPLDAQLQNMVYVPGRLFSVNTKTVRCIPGLFARNERVVAVFDTTAGPMAMVLVGAINVGCIETVWQGVVTPPHRQPINRWNYTQHDSMQLQMADEMGRFNMGSTVICLFANNSIRFDSAIVPAASTKIGQLLATF
jgi:phosphatidylserine decarboxylase